MKKVNFKLQIRSFANFKIKCIFRDTLNKKSIKVVIVHISLWSRSYVQEIQIRSFQVIDFCFLRINFQNLFFYFTVKDGKSQFVSWEKRWREHIMRQIIVLTGKGFWEIWSCLCIALVWDVLTWASPIKWMKSPATTSVTTRKCTFTVKSLLHTRDH